jgi:hypothetical protein
MVRQIKISSLNMRKIFFYLALLIVTILVILAVVVDMRPDTKVQADKYQAVTLANGQVFFGKLKDAGADEYRLTNVFYLQSKDGNSNVDANTINTLSQADIESIQLIKRGQEIHGPDDAMTIPRSQVVYVENLNSTGKVASTIIKYYEDENK